MTQRSHELTRQVRFQRAENGRQHNPGARVDDLLEVTVRIEQVRKYTRLHGVVEHTREALGPSLEWYADGGPKFHTILNTLSGRMPPR